MNLYDILIGFLEIKFKNYVKEENCDPFVKVLSDVGGKKVNFRVLTSMYMHMLSYTTNMQRRAFS